MDKIVLNDGTEVVGGMISKSGKKQVLVSIPGNDIATAAILFSNPEKTQKMTCYFSIYKYEYTGYTIFNSLSIDDLSNKIRVYISGENVSSESSYSVPEIYVNHNTGEVNNE